jgi:alcohol dehydrogenase (quinone), cytochrome c subunit
LGHRFFLDSERPEASPSLETAESTSLNRSIERMKSLATALLVLGAGAAASAQQTATPSSEGEYLARAGDCVACHSVRGGKAFAGGLRLGSPMGAIYSTNITPDTDTGIGNYSLQDFDRAVRMGVAKDGHHLYPAMPYPSYAKISAADIQALYTFFMKEVPPVKQVNKEDEIPWYLSWRWPLAIWNLLFAPTRAYVAQQDHDATWNRGAYLVEGLGHCGACHTARGWAFQEKAYDDSSSAYLQGAELDAWSAPNLRGDLRTGLGGWSPDDITVFLKSGQ